MAQWGNTDDAANSTIYAAAQVKLAPNTVNQTALFGNTTADAFITGVTVGQFGVSEAEAITARAEGKKVPHSGWILETVGSGGRAGRVQCEVLIAMNTITGDAEDTSFPDFILVITEQPVDAEVDGTESANFTVDTAVTEAVQSIQWQVSTNDGSTWADITGETGFDLTVANTDPEYVDGNLFRAVVSADGADDVTSDSALLTITLP